MSFSPIDPRVQEYFQRFGSPLSDPLWEAMVSLGRDQGCPLVDPDLGRLLGVLARLSGAEHILETGCGVGSGTLWLARAVPDGKILAWDPSRERLARAQELLRQEEQISWQEGDAEQAISSVTGGLDLVVVRGAPASCRRAIDGAAARLRVGGLLVVDELLLQGRVLDPESEDPVVEAARMLPPYIQGHPQLEAQLLALGDGVGLAVKTRATVLEQGGPY